MQLSNKRTKRFRFSTSYKYPAAFLQLLSIIHLAFSLSLSVPLLRHLLRYVFVFSLLGFSSESMAEEAHNGGGAEKEATKVAVVFTSVKPKLFVKAPKAIDAVQFYKNAFGAEEVGRVNNPKRKADQETPLILSVELKIGSFSFIVSDLTEEDSTAPYVFLIFALFKLVFCVLLARFLRFCF